MQYYSRLGRRFQVVGLAIAWSSPGDCRLRGGIRRSWAQPIPIQIWKVGVGQTNPGPGNNILADLGALGIRVRLIPSLEHLIRNEVTVDRRSALSVTAQRRLLSMGSSNVD